ncbi:hypothetical protein L249_4400 [Ophiocordyceps polyrhachis-furcata BCC 54312]|uniref:Uncharacterized protein n=1 Tax=Ophiocordyceps polyrhachis-furcata BCC 54312 TaxID=1330021 RepID=A0A367L7F8_9HYPO|nr:hypothetical protein L249_4400 [Ophiocordyceps polyrhachis-furcata BCC 54312]
MRWRAPAAGFGDARHDDGTWPRCTRSARRPHSLLPPSLSHLSLSLSLSFSDGSERWNTAGFYTRGVERGLCKVAFIPPTPPSSPPRLPFRNKTQKQGKGGVCLKEWEKDNTGPT